MKVTFLGQGFESTSVNAVGNYLIEFLNKTTFHSFTGIFAFASEAGVFGLSSHIINAKQNFQPPKKITLIVGIDQHGTSKEALEELKNLNVSSYIFYQSEFPIFHPKIYLFESNHEVKLIIGSSNLTGTGLFVNVEGSLLIEFDYDDEEGQALLMQLKTYYKTLFDLTDPNLFQISDVIISDFVAKGIVPDESTRRRSFNIKSEELHQLQSNNINIPERRSARIPTSFPRKRSTSIVVITPIIDTPNLTIISSENTLGNPNQQRVLVWQKRSLSQSDAQRVPEGTKITGNLKLSQARFKLNDLYIDQKTYFRNELFQNLAWVQTKPNNSSYEEAFCTFNISISGNPIGILNLKLSHDSFRVSSQGNTPTWLHWGNALTPILRQNNITGKTLNLYTLDSSFLIEIV